MAYYKVWDPAKAAQFPVWLLWFRRYAPWDTFGSLGYRFEGDHRGIPSTSPKATSRTYGCLFFNRNEVLYGFSGSSGTTLTFPPAWPWSQPTGHAKVSLEVHERNLPNFIGFEASTAGSNPLVPGSPDIDTIVNAKFFFNNPKAIGIMVEVFGDNFPNLEVFLKSPGGHTALLIDGRTTGGRDTGPATRLWGSHSDQHLGHWGGMLQLNDNGELSVDMKVGPVEM